MPAPVILFYSPTSQPYGPKLFQLCALQGVKLRAVESGHLDQPLSVLAQGLPPVDPSTEEAALPEPVLVFCRFSEPQLDRALLALRQSKVVCLKAVLTPTNAGWTLRQLYGELCRERAQLGGAHPPRA